MSRPVVIRKGPREQIRVEEIVSNGRQLVCVRTWFRPHEGEWQPTAKGITFRRRYLSRILAALIEIETGAGR